MGSTQADAGRSAAEGRLDPEFTSYPLREMAAAALQRAADLGATHADFRAERVRRQQISLADARLETLAEADHLGLAVRVIADGTWGFASVAELTPDAAARAAAEAVELARIARPLNAEPIVLADEPAHGDVTWLSAYETDPFSVSIADKIELLAGWSAQLLAAPSVQHVDASLRQVRECKFYADAGTTALQQRMRVYPQVTAVAVPPGGAFQTMRTLTPPAGRGYEYVAGGSGDGGGTPGGVAAELAELPDLLAAKLAAPSVRAGRYDLVIDPSNLWLVIHESIGHATELDRALGYEAAYAGTSFATPEQVGRLQYGAAAMHVTGDRTTPHGLASVGFDDEGVAAQRWDLISAGVLTGFQLDRRIARHTGAGRSNGCAFADAPEHMPIQRMANVSLQPAPGGPSVADLIAGTERGIYVVGDKSWSIDMQRYNFQFTGQRFFLISGGKLAGQLGDVGYQATTTDFWNSVEAIGGPQSYLLGGSFNCGKGQPGQVAPVSHGCPAVLVSDVRVINTAQEGS